MDNLSIDEINILAEMLKNYNPFIMCEKPENSISFSSTFKDVAEYCGQFADFDCEYEYRKENAVDQRVALELFIEEIEGDIIMKDKLSAAYWATTKGKYSSLDQYERSLLTKYHGMGGEIQYSLNEKVLKDISIGVVYAYKLPELKKELKNLTGENIILPEPVSVKKIKWSGTPGEFGAIFNKLFEMGYLDVVKDKANMARVLNEIFEIKNDQSKIVESSYLYKCFGEKEKKYNPGQLKIPFSDNYHSGK